MIGFSTRSTNIYNSPFATDRSISVAAILSRT